MRVSKEGGRLPPEVRSVASSARASAVRVSTFVKRIDLVLNVIPQGHREHQTDLLGKAPLVPSNTRSRDGQTETVCGRARIKAVDQLVYHPGSVEFPGREFQVVEGGILRGEEEIKAVEGGDVGEEEAEILGMEGKAELVQFWGSGDHDWVLNLV